MEVVTLTSVRLKIPVSGVRLLLSITVVAQASPPRITDMADQLIPEHGNQSGPCAICGKGYSYPKFGHFLCTEHGTLEYAKKADEKYNNEQ